MRCLYGLLLVFFAVFGAAAQKIAGPLTVLPGITDGYMLMNPTNYNKAYLIDQCGQVVNEWESQYAAAHTIYLKPNGQLVRTNLLENTVIDGGGGSGGGVEILDWDSELLWSYAYNTDKVRQHHDINVMPNGNILILAWEAKTEAESLAAGRDPAKIPDDVVWPEHIVEVRPIVPSGGEIVWEWHLWDHLVQDFDATKDNYGNVGSSPQLVDLNFTGAGQKDWVHANAIDYNPDLDQIIISAHAFNEIWVIDHKLTTAQAKGHTAGRYGKGGDLLYRWGNPMAYRQGTAGDTKLLGQHHTHWIPPGLPHAGKIMYFNNGPLRNYSSVEIIDPAASSNGAYTLTGSKYGPTDPMFTYTSTPQTTLFSRNMASAQMLPNGSLFIGSSAQGTTWEVSATNEVIWFYKSPITANGTVGRDYFPTSGTFASRPIFRSTKYLSDYPAFSGRNLVPREPIEGEPWADCVVITGLEDQPSLATFPNPADDKLTIQSGGFIRASLFDGQGKKVFEGEGDQRLTISTSTMMTGIYLLRTNEKVEKVFIRH